MIVFLSSILIALGYHLSITSFIWLGWGWIGFILFCRILVSANVVCKEKKLL